MAEAVTQYERGEYELTAAAAVASGEILQLPNGRAAVKTGLNAAASGDTIGLTDDEIVVKVPKTSGIVILDGGEVFWDRSASAAHYQPTGDDDFYLGCAYGDAASAATDMLVVLNRMPTYLVDLLEAFDHVPVLTSGLPLLRMVGGSALAQFSATAEAQKLDLLSRRSFDVDSDWILEAIVCVVTNCDADVGDLNVGVANETHASDADSITESAFFHFDMGADLNLDAESDDDTTEVGATDTTIDWAVGTPIHLMLDGRDPSNVKYYVNGAEVLSATANLGNLAAATGPLKALFHLEKSSNDSLGVVRLDKFCVRTSKQ